MPIEGIISALFIGITLGVFGGGGSILAVPVFVYLLGIGPVLATAYSLFVVGISTLVGSTFKIFERLICFRTAITFAIPSVIAVYLVRAFLIPAIPVRLATFGDFVITKDLTIMVLFAVLMLGVAYSMIRVRKTVEYNVDAKKSKYYYPMIALEGGLVGLLTGIVGAGGGFLIVPALVLLAKLPIKEAIGTSMFIIAAKSLIGFMGDIQSGQAIDWMFLLTFSGLTVVGIGIGIYISKYISSNKLKSSFGVFVLIMSIVILGKELI